MQATTAAKAVFMVSHSFLRAALPTLASAATPWGALEIYSIRLRGQYNARQIVSTQQ
jgi:hypothetical protein